MLLLDSEDRKERALVDGFLSSNTCLQVGGSCFAPHQFATAVGSSCPPRLPCHGSVSAAIIFITMCVMLACLKWFSRAPCQRGDIRVTIVHGRSFTHRLSSPDEHSLGLYVNDLAFWPLCILVTQKLEQLGVSCLWPSFDLEVNATLGK